MIDQIAVVTKDSNKMIAQLARLGAKTWYTDIVESQGEIRGRPVKNKLKLSFNYELGPYEFEVLEVLEGKTFQEKLSKPGISHFGIHVDDAGMEIERFKKEKNFEYIGYMFTEKHTNAGNLYYYAFLENKQLGIFVKLIQRLEGPKSKELYSPTIHLMEVLHKAKLTFQKKTGDYGTKRFKLTNKEFDEMMCFSDIYRKFIRLENHYKSGFKNMNYESIKDTYKDMLIYCAMAIMIIEKQEGKND